MYIFQKRQRTFFILFLVLLLNAYFIVACNDSGDSGGTGTSTGTTPTAEGKAISLFNFEASNNCELSSDVVGSINQNDHTISLTVPNGTVVTSLVAKFTTDGSNVKVSVDSQTSGTTANDFTGSVTYIVTAADSTTQDYIATVTISTPPSSGDGTLFVQEAYIKSLNAGMYDYTGSAVSISGDTIVVGVYGENSDATSITNGATAPSNSGGNDNGAVYVYKRTGFDWAQEAYIKAVNGEQIDRFGYSVAISGDTIVVGATLEDASYDSVVNGESASSDNSSDGSGAVYVYKRTGTTWVQEAYIKAANNDCVRQYGYVVAISNDTIVVGDPYENGVYTSIVNGTTVGGFCSSWYQAGAVYVYKRDATGDWAQEAYIKPDNNDEDDIFGISVAISGDTIAVGAKGEDSNQNTISASGSPDDSFTGYGNDAAGAVYVFKRDATGDWAQEAYIKAANNDVDSSSDMFGDQVALSGDTLIVGVPSESSNETTITNGSSASADNSNYRSGAVYVYKRDATGDWDQEAYIKAGNNDATADYFGSSISISGDLIAVGARLEDSNQNSVTVGTGSDADNSNSNSGAVYIYERTGTTWAQKAYMKAVNNDTSDFFGRSVSLSSTTVVVGASAEDSALKTITNGNQASGNNCRSGTGAVYVYPVNQ